MQSNNRGNPSIYSQQYSLFSLAYVRDRFYSLSGVFLYACLSLSTGHRRGFPCPFRAGRLPLYPVVGRPPNSLFCSWQIKALKGGLHLIMPFSFFFFSSFFCFTFLVADLHVRAPSSTFAFRLKESFLEGLLDLVRISLEPMSYRLACSPLF